MDMKLDIDEGFFEYWLENLNDRESVAYIIGSEILTAVLPKLSEDARAKYAELEEKCRKETIGKEVQYRRDNGLSLDDIPEKYL